MAKLGNLRDHFIEIGFKRLTAVECDPAISNQHEFQGIRELRPIFNADRKPVPANGVFLSDDTLEELQTAVGTLTWYDARAKANKAKREKGLKTRPSEFHLYYSAELESIVYGKAKPGDLLVIGQRPDNSVSVLIAKNGSTIESQLVWLFGLEAADENQMFAVKEITGNASRAIDATASMILEALGIAVEVKTDEYLGVLLDRYKGKFPTTDEFSKFARTFVAKELFQQDPDAALMAAFNQEEVLFKTLERHIVEQRIKNQFHSVDDFVEFSLSVHNRRKSRAGYALENHLKHLFTVNKIAFSWNATTERKSRPDFIFPGVEAYKAAKPADPELKMLAVKSSCKDRWRQVLEEADKIPAKHLLTLEPSISVSQTIDMEARHLQLVIPASIHDTYQPKQRAGLLTLRSFIDLVR